MMNLQNDLLQKILEVEDLKCKLQGAEHAVNDAMAAVDAWCIRAEAAEREVEKIQSALRGLLFTAWNEFLETSTDCCGPNKYKASEDDIEWFCSNYSIERKTFDRLILNIAADAKEKT